MQITYFDKQQISAKTIKIGAKKLNDYRAHVQDVIEQADDSKPEYSLALWKDELMLANVYEVVSSFKPVKHVVLVGIGGSSLGTEAIHSVLSDVNSPALHVLDAASAHDLDTLLMQLSTIKKVSDIAVCVISKSGNTTETLTNAEVLLASLEDQFGKAIYQQTIFIGDENNSLLKSAVKLKAHVLAMPKIVGGRFSVFSPVGLAPLMLLRHDVEALLAGLEDATSLQYEELVAESAVRMVEYMKKGVNALHFFAFDTRLVRLGKWYRQLTAESLGKDRTKKGKINKLHFITNISTPVELHSIGQLYFSGISNAYTDFVTFDDELIDYQVPKKAVLAGKLKGKTMQEISTAIYGGVISAYQASKLSYRSTVFDEDLGYSLGLFIGMRMLETMYMANLVDVNAFDQPNVELYKDLTRKILKL